MNCFSIGGVKYLSLLLVVEPFIDHCHYIWSSWLLVVLVSDLQDFFNDAFVKYDVDLVSHLLGRELIIRVNGCEVLDLFA